MVPVETSSRVPYVGLRPFEKEDWSLFFGRERETEEVMASIISHRIFLVYAASGTGKSSLINAGVVPALEKDSFDVLPTGRVRGPSPESAPTSVGNVFVRNVLANWAEADAEQTARGAQPPPRTATRGQFRSSRTDCGSMARRSSGAVSLARHLAKRPMKTDEEGPLPRVLIFDQFEELFTLYASQWHQREGFFNEVRRAQDDDEFLRVVFVMREDFLAHLDRFTPLLPDLRFRFRLEGLRRRAALDAVTKPLQGTNRSFAGGVAEHLVADLLRVRADPSLGIEEFEGEFVEPVQLQVVCRTLWESLGTAGGEITFDDLSQVGNVDSVLSRFYADAITEAAEHACVDEGSLRAAFEEAFVTSIGTRNTVYRSLSETGRIPNEVIDLLADRHLIRAEWRRGARWYELSHDRMIGPLRADNRAYFRRSVRTTAADAAGRANDVLAASDAALWAGELDRAVGLATQAEALFKQLDNPIGQAGAQCIRANALLDEGLAAEAIEVYESSLTIFRTAGDRADEALILGNLGIAHSQVGDFEQAVQHFESALQIYSELGDLGAEAMMLSNLGGVFLQLGKPDAALEGFEQARARRRQTGDTLGLAQTELSIGDALRAAGRFDDAIAAYRAARADYEAVADRSGQAVVLSALGALLTHLERFEEAISELTHAIALGSDSPLVYVARGDAYWYAGQLEPALTDFSRALHYDEEQLDALGGRGGVLAELHRYREALADFDKALEVARDAGEPIRTAYTRNGRGLALGMLGQYDEALEEFQASLAAAPDNAWVFYNRGLVLERMGRLGDALDDFQRALQAADPPLNPAKRADARARVEAVAKPASSS